MPLPVRLKNAIRSGFDFKGPKISPVPPHESRPSAALWNVVEVEHRFLHGSRKRVARIVAGELRAFKQPGERVAHPGAPAWGLDSIMRVGSSYD